MQNGLTLDTPIGVLNFVLALEHLEHACYRDGLQRFAAGSFSSAGYAPNVYQWLEVIRDQEEEHVQTIAQAIVDLGGEPVAEAAYDFGYADLAEFLDMARDLETIGVSAYQGAMPLLIGENVLLTTALTIQGVEARHAAYLNGLRGDSPFPDAFNPAMTPEEVLANLGRFIVSA